MQPRRFQLFGLRRVFGGWSCYCRAITISTRVWDGIWQTKKKKASLTADITTRHSRRITGVTNNVNDDEPACTRDNADLKPISLNRIQNSLIWLLTPVLVLLWHVKHAHWGKLEASIKLFFFKNTICFRRMILYKKGEKKNNSNIMFGEYFYAEVNPKSTFLINTAFDKWHV